MYVVEGVYKASDPVSRSKKPPAGAARIEAVHAACVSRSFLTFPSCGGAPKVLSFVAA